jgi:hypothetical protein
VHSFDRELHYRISTPVLVGVAFPYHKDSGPATEGIDEVRACAIGIWYRGAPKENTEMLILLLPVIAALVGGCAYMIVSMVAPPTRVGRWLALWIVVWAEVVLTVEILSLFDAVTPLGILVCYLGFGAIAAAVWIRRGRPRMRLLTFPSRRQVIGAFRAHPALGVLLLTVAGGAQLNHVLARARAGP